MDIDRADIAMFVYNTAAVMSGGYLAITIGIEDMLPMLPVAVGLGFVWTVYYHVSMVSLLEDIRDGELVPNDEPEPGADPDGVRDPGDEKTKRSDETGFDDGHRGVEPPWSRD
ncbi:hypothetical protein [Halorhabdus amylolytica]|uniref:hypothetical protein n=1 Tax=Halorhabdus amylolytica TaxID=2559573 RepID=UPI0010AA60F0|nr:hypothetical protein [Halorhabdus amylolytica]